MLKIWLLSVAAALCCAGHLYANIEDCGRSLETEYVLYLRISTPQTGKELFITRLAAQSGSDTFRWFPHRGETSLPIDEIEPYSENEHAITKTGITAELNILGKGRNQLRAEARIYRRRQNDQVYRELLANLALDGVERRTEVIPGYRIEAWTEQERIPVE